MTTTFLGNIDDIFDCEKLISQAIQHRGETHTGHLTLPEDHPEYENFIIQDKLSKQAGYDVKSFIRGKLTPSSVIGGAKGVPMAAVAYKETLSTKLHQGLECRACKQVFDH